MGLALPPLLADTSSRHNADDPSFRKPARLTIGKIGKHSPAIQFGCSIGRRVADFTRWQPISCHRSSIRAEEVHDEKELIRLGRLDAEASSGGSDNDHWNHPLRGGRLSGHESPALDRPVDLLGSLPSHTAIQSQAGHNLEGRSHFLAKPGNAQGRGVRGGGAFVRGTRQSDRSRTAI